MSAEQIYSSIEPAYAEAKPIADDREFALKTYIGGGEQARVYLATHLPTGDDVALKIARAGHEEALAAEINMLSSLRHPNVMPLLFRSDPTARTQFFAMPVFRPFNTLGSTQEKMSALAMVAEGLDYMHEHDIVHRDVKMTNLLVSPEGDALLADLGHSCRATMQQPRHFGVLPYMAPEVEARAPHTIQSDIYCLGVAAHRAIFGTFPDPRGSSVPAISQAMAANPHERFSSGSEFVYALAGDIRNVSQ